MDVEAYIFLSDYLSIVPLTLVAHSGRELVFGFHEAKAFYHTFKSRCLRLDTELRKDVPSLNPIIKTAILLVGDCVL